MPEENKHINLSIVLAGAALIVASLLFVIPKGLPRIGIVPPVESGNAKVGLPASPVGRPMRLKIPKINVDAVVEQVGVALDGTMDVPKGPSDVAWFKFGPRPGEQGSAVIAGHYGWKNNTPAAFDAVSSMQKGDKIYVEDDTGETVAFVVRESRLYNPKADASNIFDSSDGKAHLNLITCEGVWDASSKSYSKRLVVFTDKE